jgi:misacylated tRNA(Ala) deacylase
MTLLFRDDAYLKSCTARVLAAGDGRLVLDRTVFYPTGGGQPGDSGRIIWSGGDVAVTGAVKGEAGQEVVHLVDPGAVLPAPGTEVEAVIDWERRYRLMRMHTALHVMCAVVRGDVTGGQVGEERSRLDFNLAGEVPEKEAVTARLNEIIAADHPVAERWIADEELAARPDLVRTMSVKPPMGTGRVRLLQIGADGAVVDLQPCGGTHVAHIGEIGPVELVKIENKGKMNRRFNLALARP